VEGVEKDSPAAKAGLKAGDIITGVNGKRIFNALSLVDEIERHPNEELTLEVRRGGEQVQLKMRPALLEAEGTTRPRIGIRWDAGGRLSLSHPDPVEQVYHSITSTLQTIGAVASPSSDVKLQHMSGPIMIVRIYYMLFESDNGWKLALWFSVILNVNLAILNMLPIPVLDGGHIVLALIESVRRKPVNMKILEWVQTACATLIIGYMLYISFFDIGDLLGKNSDQKSSKKQSPAAEKATPAP
jgi:regulator of sigma E protease